jgi:hypothetical protein
LRGARGARCSRRGQMCGILTQRNNVPATRVAHQTCVLCRPAAFQDSRREKPQTSKCTKKPAPSAAPPPQGPAEPGTVPASKPYYFAPQPQAPSPDTWHLLLRHLTPALPPPAPSPQPLAPVFHSPGPVQVWREGCDAPLASGVSRGSFGYAPTLGAVEGCVFLCGKRG